MWEQRVRGGGRGLTFKEVKVKKQIQVILNQGGYKIYGEDT